MQSESGKKSGEQAQAQPKGLLSRILKDYFFAIAGAAIVALLLRIYVIEAFRIPTDFMSPVLLPGDHIFVNKLAYAGPMAGKPARGEIVVFSFPSDLTRDYIKRVIAIEGDDVEIKDGVVYLNGKAIGREVAPGLVEEELDGRRYQAQWMGAAPGSRKMSKVKVPPGQVFVLGDNRAKGQDSRAFGFLPASSVEGRASLIWFSVGDGIRWARLLTRVN